MSIFHSLELPVNQTPVKKNKSKSILKNIFLGLGLFFITIGVLIYFFVFRPAQSLLTSVKQVQASATAVNGYLKNQDLGGVKKQLDVVNSDLDKVKTEVNRFAWTKPLPFFGSYYSDAQHGLAGANELLTAGRVAIDTIAPYADIIGLKGIAATSDGAKTAQERINFILNTLEKLQPQMETLGAHLQNAQNEISQIDPKRYPEDFKGTPIRSQLVRGLSILSEATTLTNEARPLLAAAPYILGMDSPRKYLVVFQNDAELRPTGGFMTAYAILQLNKGKISTLDSGDIYTLDAKFPKKITAPAPILKYLPKVPYWNLRDMNLSPDFKVSMDTFYPNYRLTGSPAVDGVISMDTQVLVELLKITGQVGVPGFGNFSATTDPICNCPQVFYALELYADVEGPVIWDSVSGRIIAQPTNYGQRKSFIGPMMYSILSNVMAQPKSKMSDLFNTGMQLIAEKHIQFYLLKPDAQAAVEAFNLAGRVRDTKNDYLMVVDTNFAGAKTNAWVTYTASLKVDIASDGTTNTLTLVYQNPKEFFEDAKTKLRLNGVFRDWIRVYLPAGSQLVEGKGFESGPVAGQDLGKTVVEGFFTLTPKNNRTLIIKYKTPIKFSSAYHLLIQKQAGSKNFPYKITVNNQAQPELILDSDKDFSAAY